MPDPTKPRVKATRKKTNGVYDTDSPSKAAESGQSPTASRDANSTGAAGSNSAEQLWDETADLVRICGKLVDKKRSAAIRSAVEKWSQAPKHERQSITALAREIGVSRQYIHRVLRKSAPLEDAASRVSEARNPEPDQPRDLQEPEDDVNRSVNCALVDTEPQNRQESTARAIGRNETLIEAGRLTRFQVGASANPGGRPRLKPLSTAYRRMLDKIVPGTNQTYADLVAEGMVRSAAKGRSDAARELCDRVEGKIPRPVEAEGAYSLIIDASEVPAAFKPVRLPEELPAAVDGDQREPEEQSEQGDASDYQAARQQLNRRLNEVANCTFVGVKLERILVEELAEDFLRDYRVNEKKSLTDAVGRWKHLRPFFGHMRAMNVSTQLINSYVDARLQEGAQNVTINRELAALKRAFNLGYRSTPRKVQQVPAFPHLKENPPHKGFASEQDYEVLSRNCEELWLMAILELASTYGFRREEFLGLRVRQFDPFTKQLDLDPGATKNGEGRKVVLTKKAYDLLMACVRGKKPEDFILTRNDGKPVRDFRASWHKLCIRSGKGQMFCKQCQDEKAYAKFCPDCGARLSYRGLLVHDQRRSAVRNMVRRGIPERVAMTISGHKTRSVFERYNIVNEADITEAARKLERPAVSHDFSHDPGKYSPAKTAAGAARPN